LPAVAGNSYRVHIDGNDIRNVTTTVDLGADASIDLRGAASLG